MTDQNRLPTSEGQTFYTNDAHDFYRRFIYNIEHQLLLTQHGFHTAGSIAPVNWELFASILTGDQGKQGYGSDLENYEVKSAKGRGGFEYQYHLNGGQKKLQDDMVVQHIFVSYSPDYADIEVRILEGEVLKPFFLLWQPGLIKNYEEGPNRKQRYRKRIPYGVVKNSGKLILKTENGNLI